MRHLNTDIHYDQLFMLCGGTGITPMYQLARYLIGKVPMYLVYANKSEADILLGHELGRLAKEGLQIRYTIDHATP
jgi:NAD(P)H-flavin reductase